MYTWVKGPRDPRFFIVYIYIIRTIELRFLRYLTCLLETVIISEKEKFMRYVSNEVYFSNMIIILNLFDIKANKTPLSDRREVLNKKNSISAKVFEELHILLGENIDFISMSMTRWNDRYGDMVFTDILVDDILNDFMSHGYEYTTSKYYKIFLLR
jgi:hypothetical protein